MHSWALLLCGYRNASTLRCRRIDTICQTNVATSNKTRYVTTSTLADTDTALHVVTSLAVGQSLTFFALINRWHACVVTPTSCRIMSYARLKQHETSQSPLKVSFPVTTWRSSRCPPVAASGNNMAECMSDVEFKLCQSQRSASLRSMTYRLWRQSASAIIIRLRSQYNIG